MSPLRTRTRARVELDADRVGHEHPEILISASRDGMTDSAHGLTDGGLIQAVVSGCAGFAYWDVGISVGSGVLGRGDRVRDLRLLTTR